MNNCEEFNLELFSSQLHAFDATIEQLESSNASASMAMAWGCDENENDSSQSNEAVDRLLAASNLALKKSSQLSSSSSSSSSSSMSFVKPTHKYSATPRRTIYTLPFQNSSQHNRNHSNRLASNSHTRHPCECDSCIDGPPPSLKDYNDRPMQHKSDLNLQDEINNSTQKNLESSQAMKALNLAMKQMRLELEEVKKENRRLLESAQDSTNEIAVLNKNLESAMRVNKEMKMSLNEYEIGATQSMLRSAKEFFVKTQVGGARGAPSSPSSPSPPLSPLASTLEVEWDKE